MLFKTVNNIIKKQCIRNTKKIFLYFPDAYNCRSNVRLFSQAHGCVFTLFYHTGCLYKSFVSCCLSRIQTDKSGMSPKANGLTSRNTAENLQGAFMILSKPLCDSLETSFQCSEKHINLKPYLLGLRSPNCEFLLQL